MKVTKIDGQYFLEHKGGEIVILRGHLAHIRDGNLHQEVLTSYIRRTVQPRMAQDMETLNKWLRDSNTPWDDIHIEDSTNANESTG